MQGEINMDLDLTYTFSLDQKTLYDYRCTKEIIQWLKGNMESLTDDKGNTLFSKVNFGYNENTLKGFGKKPVCDIYIDSLDYSSDLETNVPSSVRSFIICYLKGNMNNAYLKACELTDFIVQEFEETNSFRELPTIVRETFIRNVELQIIPGTKTYGVLVAFELEHELY